MMGKSKLFIAFVLAAIFLVGSVAISLSGTFASGGKVVPPGWCLEHGYIGVEYGEEYSECRYCD